MPRIRRKSKEGGRPRYLWFKLLLAVGAALGLLLLVQSIVNYFFVSSRLVINQLHRDANKQAAFLERHARQMRIRDPAELADLLDDVRKEGEHRIAWIRVTGFDGHVFVQSGEAIGPPFRNEQLRPLIEDRDEVSEIRDTPGGKVLVTVVPLRLPSGAGAGGSGLAAASDLRSPPRTVEDRPARGRGAGSRLVEFALYLDSTRSAFWPLRRNLIISCSAALALVASMVLLALRFGHYVRGKQLERQMELARQVQQDLLPTGDPPVEGLELAAACVPAWQVGGDFYDVFLDERGRVALLLGDVSGKGLPAALLMGLLHGAVHASVSVGTAHDLEAASARLNELLRIKSSRERFASLFWCYYDGQRQILRYVNAGHLPPALFRANGSGGQRIELLDEGGPVLGLLPAASYHEAETCFTSGDLLVLYSDGVVEATNSGDQEFGEERLRALIYENWSCSCKDIRDEILKSVHTFLRGQPVQDDLTLLVVRAPNTNSPVPA